MFGAGAGFGGAAGGVPGAAGAGSAPSPGGALGGPTGAPAPEATAYTGPQPWKAGLFECSNDPEICCMGMCMSPCLYGCNTSTLRGMGCFLDSLAYMLPLPPFLLCAYMASNFRKELRTNFNLIEEPCSDGVVHTFCGPCALCQEAYELKAQGYGMGMGMGYGMGMGGMGMGGMGMGMGGMGMGGPGMMGAQGMMGGPGMMGPQGMMGGPGMMVPQGMGAQGMMGGAGVGGLQPGMQMQPMGGAMTPPMPQNMGMGMRM